MVMVKKSLRTWHNPVTNKDYPVAELPTRKDVKGLWNKKLVTDESGIAWGLAAVFMMIVFGGAYYLFQLPILNELIRPINTYIGTGMISQETADASSFGTAVIVFLPIVMLLGMFGWMIVRAHQRREY